MRIPSTHAVEVLSLGRTYVNLESEQIGCSLKAASSFKKTISGTCALVSIGLSRLGRYCALLSKIGSDPLGEYIKETLVFEKIDPTLLISDPNHATLIGLNNSSFYEHHSLLELEERDIDPKMIGHAKALFLTSEIFCHEANHCAARKAIVAAKDNQTKIILALELWPSLGRNCPPSQSLETILPFCNLIFGYEEEFKAFANTQNTYEALTYLRELTHATIVIKCAKESYVFEDAITDHWKPLSRHAQFDPIQFAPLHEYAAFVAGFIDVWLKGEPPANALKQAILCQQLAEAAPTHLGLPTEKMLRHRDMKESRPAYFKHLHYATTRHVNAAPQCLLSFGYHSQWEKIANSFNASEEMIQKAKALIAQSLFSLNEPQTPVGLIVDEKPGNELIHIPIPSQAILARCIELENEIPLRFATTQDLSHTLLKWPSEHVAKVSITYHPDDRYVTRGEQETMLLSLYQACRDTEHPLLIDITPPTNSLITASTLGHIMQRFYDLGVYPDWWQFAAPRDQRSWDSIHRVIEDNDPDCLGAFIQMPATTLDQLSIILDQAIKQSMCKGIVIGKTLIQPILEQWLSQKIADHILIEQIKPLFEQIITLWQSKKNVHIREGSVS